MRTKKLADLQVCLSVPLKCHKTYFVENLWVAASDVSCIYFSFLFEFADRA